MTALDQALKFIGIKEQPGSASNPLVLFMLQHVAGWVQDDAVAWCSAFVGFIAWLWDLPQSNSLAARSWLKVGTPISLVEARPGFDIVVLKRGANSPGPSVLEAEGHVGFFVSQDIGGVTVLGGNQGDAVSIEKFPVDRVLGVRRLAA
jgi:uncharacterized protein (TIGR02594 family)